MASGARLTAAVLCEAQVSQERVQSGFVSLRQSLSGRLVCYPGVSLAKNGWIVPSPNLVGGLVGSFVLLVAEDGSVDSDGPRHRVAAVLDSSGVTMAHKTMSLGECAVGSDVFVVFGRPAWETSWTRSPKTWVDYDNSLRSAFETFKIIEDEVPRLREYAQEKSKLKEMPWIEIAREIADGVDRQDARLESAANIMSIVQLRQYVEDWRKECGSVDKLIKWSLFTGDRAPKTLAEFSRPGAYEQPFFPQTVACNMGS